MSKEKEYQLTKEELFHISNLDYAIQYLDRSIQQFVLSIIKERLNLDVTDKKLQFKVNDDKLVLWDEE